MTNSDINIDHSRAYQFAAEHAEMLPYAATVAASGALAASEHFGSVTFERPIVAYGAVAAMVVVESATWFRDRQNRAIADEVSAYPGAEDMAKVGRRQVRMGRAMALLAGVSLSLTVGAGMMDAARPIDTSTTQKATSVALVVEGGKDAIYAEDVTDAEGHDIARVQAVENAILASMKRTNPSVQYSLFMAGTTATQIGEGAYRGGVDKARNQDIVAKSKNYLEDISNEGDPDIGGGLQQAGNVHAAQTILFTSNDSAATSDAIGGYKGKLSVISVGTSGTKYNFLGGPNHASFTSQFGDNKAEVATTTEELEDDINSIATKGTTVTKISPNKLYEKIRNGAAIASLALLGAGQLTPRRGVKKRRKSDRKGDK